MPITIDGNGIITGAATLATTVANPTFTTPNINSAQFATVSGTAPIYPCRAWVNFNGTGTVAIRASGNVSSITDNGTGNYTINFTTAMPDANFATAGTAHDVSNTSKPRFVGSYAKATGSCSIAVSYQDGLLIDATNVEIAIFR
jgi:hypothetical protein